MRNILVPLPEDVFERIEAEAAIKCLKPMQVARMAVLDKYGSGVSAVSVNSMNHGDSAGKMQETAT